MNVFKCVLPRHATHGPSVAAVVHVRRVQIAGIEVEIVGIARGLS